MPKVSIIVPVYNVEDYIEKCLESLLNQTLEDIEIIVVNDGSTDESKKKINPYIEKYPDKVKYLEKENGGLSSARNYGIPKASGDYIAFLDSDDYVENNMYQKMYEIAITEQSDMVECDFIWEYPNKKRKDIAKTYKNKKEMIVKGRVVAWNKLIKRDIIEKNNLRFPEGLRYEDVEFFYKLVPYINKVSFVHEPFIHYVQRSNSIANTQNLRTKEIFTILNNVLKYYKENNLYEEYKEELEYIYARFLLCSSLRRMLKIPNKKDRKEAIEETISNLENHFPKWGENIILNQEKTLKNLYLKIIYEFKFKYKTINKVQKWLSIFVILCPILDIISFLYRNEFKTNISPSTFIRPLIPGIILIYYFFKENNKKRIMGIGLIYLLYSGIHLYIFDKIKTEISYGGILNELQYLINYGFMIVTLYVFAHTFKNKETNILNKSVVISLSIYIISILISIATKTSSTTYIEGVGYKGWFESGNSLCTVLLLGLFYILSNTKFKEIDIYKIILITLIGIYLMFLSGMRTGLYGFIMVILLYVISNCIESVLNKTKINKRLIVLMIGIGLILVLGVIFIGSQTLVRRRQLNQNEINNLDLETGEVRYVSGDVLALYKDIKNDTISKAIPKDVKNAIVKLCEYAQKNKMSNVNARKQQLVYNYYLILEQKNPVLILFGNGYKAQFRELVMEMEIPSILLNFGIIGVVLYLVPFLIIWGKACLCCLEKLKRFPSKNIMCILGMTLGLGLSVISGYVLFNCSSMIMMVVLATELRNKNE